MIRLDGQIYTIYRSSYEKSTSIMLFESIRINHVYAYFIVYVVLYVFFSTLRIIGKLPQTKLIGCPMSKVSFILVPIISSASRTTTTKICKQLEQKRNKTKNPPLLCFAQTRFIISLSWILNIFLRLIIAVI